MKNRQKIFHEQLASGFAAEERTRTLLAKRRVGLGIFMLIGGSLIALVSFHGLLRELIHPVELTGTEAVIYLGTTTLIGVIGLLLGGRVLWPRTEPDKSRESQPTSPGDSSPRAAGRGTAEK